MTKAPQDPLTDLKAHLAVISDLAQAQAVLSWDENVYLPEGAAPARGQQLATLSRVIHERATDPKIGGWLDALGEPSSADEAALARVARREYRLSTKLPGDFVEDFTRIRSAAQAAWVGARAASDFSQFAPHLEKIVALNLRQADYLGYDTHPYDALHDLYEMGSTTEKVRAVFADLRDATVPLVRDIAEGRDVSDAPLRQVFSEPEQEAFAVKMVEAFGYSFRHGRLDRTVHPFATSFSKYDVRITTRYDPNFLSPALFGTLHEAGHAMYEQGISSSFDRSPLGAAVSLGIHESQSRMWENLVGRSYGFWRWAYPQVQETFPAQLGNVPLDDFYAAINKVAPSFIRVEADEVTYNLHVMVRFELELALLEGSLKISELPEAWNAKYGEYLGITPPNDAEGCLQDIHWSLGMMGYFPTYTLGNIMSVQLFEAAASAVPTLGADIEGGRFDGLLGWLRENVHQHGSRFEPAELLRRATGSDLDAGPYVAYLNRKFRALYGIER
ncbi:MAG: Thermostable carboxypeptidase 1 [uncultured Truepera sp.]|uniref:Metal-dependent carboxypeptidase n=1 Tax=uncultured Truepera sp. TaxID=543023 RepID=A0A6J4VSZ8_9DEIN|nr:MAG: Thermostable carboxypeptidase 1 [uncultured Truepera sp.]